MARLITLLTGRIIGKWRVGESFRHSVYRVTMYHCQCECGTKKDVRHSHLVSGSTHSCGCSWTTHGMSRSKEYKIWDSMVRRCHNPSHKAFPDYGGRGITVCEKWRSFDGFFEDMGLKPAGMSIERINNSLGYSKENCKWATIVEQSRNRRSTKLTEEDADRIRILSKTGASQSDIAAQFGVTRSAIGHVVSGSTWRT